MKRSNETKSSASGAEIKKARSESSQKPRSDDSQKSGVEFLWTPEEVILGFKTEGKLLSDTFL